MYHWSFAHFKLFLNPSVSRSNSRLAPFAASGARGFVAASYFCVASAASRRAGARSEASHV
jgi:hypothetical protein